MLGLKTCAINLVCLILSAPSLGATIWSDEQHQLPDHMVSCGVTGARSWAVLLPQDVSIQVQVASVDQFSRLSSAPSGAGGESRHGIPHPAMRG